MSETEVVERLEHAVDKPPLQLDKFGRDEQERTVVLESDDAEAVNLEVENGKHQSYSDALHHIIARGLAEIKRTRDLQQRNQAKTKLADKSQEWTKILQMKPDLVSDPVLMQKMALEIATLASKCGTKK